jgi:segregation and condensation protein B
MTKIEKTIETLLYIQGQKGISPHDIKKIFNIGIQEARKEIKKFQKKYNKIESGLQIIEFNDIFKIATRKEEKENILKLINKIKKQKLSSSAIETIGIIAYKQPITKSEINNIRGISSEGVVNTLLRKQLIEKKGISNKIGKPILYGITNKFYDYFNIKSLDELPNIEEIENLSNEESFDLFGSQREE